MASEAAYSSISRGDVVGGRLGHEHDQLHVGVGVEPGQGGAGRESRTVGGEVAATDAERRRDADPGVVEQREQLLAAGAGGGDDPHRAGRGDVGEAEAEPADDRRAAVRAHHQEVALGGDRLEGNLLLERDVVAEDHHVAAGVEGVHRLDEGVGARHRDEDDRLRREPQRGGRRAWRRELRGGGRTGSTGTGPRRRPRARRRARRSRPGAGRRPGRREQRRGR